MKFTIEVHETAKRVPTRKDAVGSIVLVYDRRARWWTWEVFGWVQGLAHHYPFWASLKGFPKPAPLRKRK